MCTLEILFITIITCSVLAWLKPGLQDKLVQESYAIRHHKEGYRLITHAFVHLNIFHLTVNAVMFRDFGRVFLEQQAMSSQKDLHFLLLFFGGVLFSGCITHFQYAKEFEKYLGASAGIFSIAVATTLADPMMKVRSCGVILLPAWETFLILTSIDFLLRNKATGIDHKGHLAGAFYGLLFALYLNPNVLSEAWDKIKL
ncbi:MAG: rhomboid family intramembrane serine protease [Cytophagales bacterium]